jgi:uncharacterized membrane protein
MQLYSHYRKQARLSLKGHWGKSALTFWAVLAVITIPAVGIIIGGELSSSTMLTLLALLLIIAIIPATLGLCVAFLQHTRTSDATFLLDTWHLTIKHYGRFLGCILLLYLISMVISGVMTGVTTWMERSGSIISVLVTIPVVLWMCFLMLQVSYGYRLTPYLLCDNPDMKVIEAMRQSYRMMKGYKRDLLLLDLSIMQWYIYPIIIALLLYGVGANIESVGLLVISGVMYIAVLVGILFLYPYLLTTSALFYTDRLAESTEPEEDKAEVSSAEETESPSQL